MPKETPLARAQAFCARFDLRLPIAMAPMAGASPPALAAAVANAGGLGACGALLMTPETMANWADAMRALSNGGFQINLWIPDPTPARNAASEAAMRAFLGEWGPEPELDDGDAAPLDFDAQCAALLAASPPFASSIMGLYPPDMVALMKARGTRWIANATTVGEAKAAVAAGADIVVAQGAEAGGHRGSFEPDRADGASNGLFALLPAIVDAVGDDVPVIATGGIADGRGVAAALLLGASAVQIGTGLLRTPEAGVAPAWANALIDLEPEDTTPTRAFSGRLGRSARTAFVEALATPDAPSPAPYPVQRGLTQKMRAAAARKGDPDAMQLWAGQAARLATTEPAAAYVTRLWDDARALLGAV